MGYALSRSESYSRRTYWLCQCTGWGLYTLARLYGATTLLHEPWARATGELLLLDGIALGLTHCLRLWARQRQWHSLGTAAITLRIVWASMLLALPVAFLSLWTRVSALQDPSPLFESADPVSMARFAEPILFAVQLVNWTVVFALWLIIYFVATTLRRQRFTELRHSELARALQLAELRLLKTQLNPHFLFNSLNTVRSLIADQPATAQLAVTHLANTLRYTLSAGRGEMVALAQELEIVRAYLALESLRFEDRLSVQYDIEPATDPLVIPVMLLQTIVENAIKHGIAELPQGGAIRISAHLADGLFLLQVENPRPPTALKSTSEGIGLRNADERLRLLFGSGASLDLDLSNAAIATARIRIPQAA